MKIHRYGPSTAAQLKVGFTTGFPGFHRTLSNSCNCVGMQNSCISWFSTVSSPWIQDNIKPKIYSPSLILVLIFVYNTPFCFGVIQKTSLAQAGKTGLFFNLSVEIHFAESLLKFNSESGNSLPKRYTDIFCSVEYLCIHNPPVRHIWQTEPSFYWNKQAERTESLSHTSEIPISFFFQLNCQTIIRSQSSEVPTDHLTVPSHQ